MNKIREIMNTIGWVVIITLTVSLVIQIKQNEMYKKNKRQQSQIKLNQSTEGETIETKVERIMTNSEPITDGAPIIFTERKDGVNPAYDVRTDRFEIAIEAMDKVSKTHLAKREAKIVEMGKKTDGKSSENEPIQGQSNNPKPE